MKTFSFIFALYILSLAVMPCKDFHPVLNEAPHATEYHAEHEPNDTHDHNEDSDNHCSPFCICTCCHTSINFELSFKTSPDFTIFVQVSTDDNTFLYYDSPSSTYQKYYMAAAQG
jgi:hypothetical protein